MKKLLISASAIALIAGGNFALAQSMNREAPSPAPPAQQSAPAEKIAPPGVQKPDGGTTGQGSPRIEQQERSRDSQAPDRMKSGDPKSPGSRASDGKSDMKSDDKPSTSSQAPARDRNTTGQGAAGASGNLSAEQRTRITTSIKETNVRPVTNVNFNISVGTVVPRDMTLHPLPATIVEVYPAWRGYRFVLVGDEIIIIEPSSYKIIAVIDA